LRANFELDTTVRHLAAGFVQLCRPALRVARRGEDDRHALLDDRFDDLVGIPVHERDVHAEGFPCGFAAAADMFAQQVGLIEPEPISPRPPASLTAAASRQPLHHIMPPATMGVADSEQGADSVFHDFSSCYFLSCASARGVGRRRLIRVAAPPVRRPPDRRRTVDGCTRRLVSTTN